MNRRTFLKSVMSVVAVGSLASSALPLDTSAPIITFNGVRVPCVPNFSNHALTNADEIFLHAMSRSFVNRLMETKHG